MTLAIVCVGKVNHPLFVTTNQCIPVKINWAEVLPCFVHVRDNTVIFCSVLCVHKVDFWLVTNKIPNKWQQVFVKKKLHPH